MRGGNARNSGNRNHRNSRQYNNNNNNNNNHNNGGSNNNSSSGNYGQQAQQVPPPHHAAAAAVAIHPVSHSQQQQQQHQQQQHHHHHHHQHHQQQQTQSQLPLLPNVIAQAPQPPVLSATQFITPAGYMIPGVPQSVIHNVPITSPFPIDIEHHHQQQQQQHQHHSNGMAVPSQISDDRYAIHCLQPSLASDYVLDPHQIHHQQQFLVQQQPQPLLQQQLEQQNRVSSTGTSTSADDHQSDQSLSTSDNNDNSEKTSENSTGNISFADQSTKSNEDFDSNGAQTIRQYSYSNKQIEYSVAESHQIHQHQNPPPPPPPLQNHYLNHHQQTAFVPATAAPPFTQFYHQLPTTAMPAAHATPHMQNSQPQGIYTPNSHHHHPAMGTPLYITHMMHASVMPHYAFNIGPPIAGHPYYANQPPLPPQVYSHLQHHPSQHPQPHPSTQFHPGYQHIQAHHPHQHFQHQLVTPTARIDPVVDEEPQQQQQQENEDEEPEQQEEEQEQQQQQSEIKKDSTIPDSEILIESSNMTADAENTVKQLSMPCEQQKDSSQQTFYSTSFQQSSNQFRSRTSSNSKFQSQSTKDNYIKKGSNSANGSSTHDNCNNSLLSHTSGSGSVDGGTNEQQRNTKKDSVSNVNIINTINDASDSPHLKIQQHFPNNNSSHASNDNTTNIVNKNEQQLQTSIHTNSTSNGLLKKNLENNKVTSVNKDDKAHAEKPRTSDQNNKQVALDQVTQKFSSNCRINTRRDAKSVMSSTTSLANEAVVLETPKPATSSQSIVHSQTSAEIIVPVQSPLPQTSSETASTSATQPETVEIKKATQQAAMITAAIDTKKPIETIPKVEQTWAKIVSNRNLATQLSSSSTSVLANTTTPTLQSSTSSTPGLSYPVKSSNSSKINFDSHSSSHPFKPSSGSSTANSNGRYSINSSDYNAKKAKFEGPLFHRIGEFLDAYEVNRRVIGFQPRGLLNRNNYCYVNSILQSLCACSPFVNLFLSLSEYTTKMTSEKSSIPILNGMTEFFREFSILPKEKFGRNKDRLHKKDDVNVGLVFEPTQIYKILNSIDSLNNDGKQQDAEEFFGRLLNGINDEMNELIKFVNEEKEKFTTGNHSCHNQKLLTSSLSLANGNIAATTAASSSSAASSATKAPEDNDNEWTEMGPRNKSSIIRRMNLNITPISCIFGGQLRSKIHRCGEQDTDNIQPFLTLPLNIDKANSILEAIEMMTLKEPIEGMMCSKTNREIEAWQQVLIEDLPLVLVLHLKYFRFKEKSCTKIVKNVEFPIDLKFDSKFLYNQKYRSLKQKPQYKLFAVVYHIGRDAYKGHYITDAYHSIYGTWIRYDDSAVTSITEHEVLTPHDGRVPYLLFYRRCDF